MKVIEINGNRLEPYHLNEIRKEEEAAAAAARAAYAKKHPLLSWLIK